MHSLYQHGPKINEDIFISIISYKGRQKIWVMNNVFGPEALKSHEINNMEAKFMKS